MDFKLLDSKSQKVVIATLEKEYPNAKYYLNFKTPLELLVAAILSAQTRDEVVNASTPELFKVYKTVADYASTKPEVLIKYISKISFSGAKANNIIKTCKILQEKYGSKVPDKMEDLVELPGIGRKTANTILINAFGIVEGIPVDTWVIKLSGRIGLSKSKDPEDIEQDLMKIVDKKYWHNITYVMKTHGKKICQSTVPICSACMLNKICPQNGVVNKK